MVSVNASPMPAPPSAFDLLMEARWEQEGVRRAARRYREAAAAADPSTLPSGQKLLREIVPPLTAKITELQLKGADMLSTPGKPPKWALPIQLVGAETLAVITMIRSLAGAEVPTDQSASVTGLSLDIAQAVHDELDYRSWIEAQAKVNKAAREAKDWDHVDLLAAFKARYPAADRQAWRSFRRRLELVKAEPWDKETSIQLGAALIHALIEAAPARFEIDTRPLAGGRTQNYLSLSAETRRMIQDVETRAEVARPMLMPMLIPPIPWSYE